ncbi:MAG TPA: ParA family protein [bacterium]|jgi:chromosome partitioning protein
MTVVSFLHQKGGTGKSTLAIASAIALAQAGHRVLLLDADYQGTSSEWGNRFAQRFGLETRSQVQPIVHEEVQRFRPSFQWIVIDGPPSLSEMTESILRASDRVIIPVRPALPDVWAIPWLAAIIRKLRQGGQGPRVRIVFNQYAGEPLAPLREELQAWRLPVHEVPLPADPAFAAVFAGEALPGPLAEQLLEVIDAAGG